MAFNPATDKVGIWRLIAGAVAKGEMPALDFVVQALARAGIATVTASATPPLASQSVTAWLQTAVPSYSGEGVLNLWNGSAYVPATPALFETFLQNCAGQSGVSWWTAAGGPPLNTIGNNGDFAFRLDAPFGVYGPKALGAWPAAPIPGTADVITSTSLDNAFGAVQGNLIVRGPAVWQSLGVGGSNSLLASNGAAPLWEALTAIFDAVFSNVEGSVLYRDAAQWQALPIGPAAQVLTSQGAGQPPAWKTNPATFESGTTMLFQQTAAPLGWTKQTALDDYGLRVTAGTVGSISGTPFSTVFAQSAVGNTTLTTATIPNHSHPQTGAGFGSNGTLSGTGTGATSALNGFTAISQGSVGSSGAHTHSIQMQMAYLDVIIATKN